MPFTVYVLYSERCDKIYVGFTSNLEGRLNSHNELATKGWTIKFRPWSLLYTEQFETKQEAMRREKELKSAQGRIFIRNMIIKKANVGLIPASWRAKVRVLPRSEEHTSELQS